MSASPGPIDSELIEAAALVLGVIELAPLAP